ncbi:MAG: RDD family protein [Prochloraceae cyanobacterium]
MFDERRPYRDYPKVPIKRRAGAFLIDLLVVWFLSAIVGNGFLQFLLFMGFWWVLRVVVTDKNQGQSLGNWCLDIKVIDLRYARVPDLLTLSKREGIAGFAAYLATCGLSLIFNNAISTVILILPLLANFLVAVGDNEYSQAFHERVTETISIPCDRGFSLDLRLLDLLDEIKDKMRQ